MRYFKDTTHDYVTKTDNQMLITQLLSSTYVETDKAEYDAYELVHTIYPQLAQDNVYLSLHKNAETLIQNSIITQIEELRTGQNILSVDGGNGNNISKLKINGIEVDSVALLSLSDEDKRNKLLAYKIELLVMEIAKQRVYKNDISNGGNIDDAYKHTLSIHLTSQDAIDGKALHISWLVSKLGQSNYDTYIKDTHDVDYSTHLSEDEGVIDE